MMNQTQPPNAPGRARPPSPTKILLLISALIGLTVTRAFAIMFIPKLAMLGGDAPNAWLGPWATDAALGLLIPVVVLATLRLRTARVWAALLMYNTLGAFDYLTGMLTQWQHPLPASIAPQGLVFGSLSFTLLIQTAVIALLFRRDVINHFTQEAQCN